MLTTQRTAFAEQAVMLAMAFKVDLGGLRIPPGDYRPEVTTPIGASTSGGLILQRIRLVPRTTGYTALVIGDVKLKDSKAELRSFDYVDAVHRRRASQPFPISREAYADVVAKIRDFFDTSSFRTSIAPPPATLGSDPPPSQSR